MHQNVSMWLQNIENNVIRIDKTWLMYPNFVRLHSFLFMIFFLFCFCRVDFFYFSFCVCIALISFEYYGLRVRWGKYASNAYRRLPQSFSSCIRFFFFPSFHLIVFISFNVSNNGFRKSFAFICFFFSRRVSLPSFLFFVEQSNYDFIIQSHIGKLKTP